MKFLLILCLLITGIQEMLCAQTAANNLLTPAATNYEYSIVTTFEDGNAMRLDVYGDRTKAFNKRIDSLANILTEVVTTMKDSMATGAYARTLIVNCYDTLARETILRNTPPASLHFLQVGGQKGFVKSMQDTLVINLYTDHPDKTNPQAFYQLSFYLNDVEDITKYNYRNFGDLFAALPPGNSADWQKDSNGRLLLSSNKNIELLKGYDPTHRTSSIMYNVGISLQNYRDVIVPSFSAGLGWFTEKNYKQRQYWFLYETQVVFERGEKSKKRTLLNDFVSVGYKSVRLDKAAAQQLIIFNRFVSLGYLIRRKAEIYDPHTFKLNVGQFYIGRGSLRIEPTLYFHKFFQGIIPSFRITQSF